jgi:hypothetical protein
LVFRARFGGRFFCPPPQACPIRAFGQSATMRQSKEIMVLIALFVGMASFVIWYVIDRRAKNRAVPPTATRTLAPEPAAAKP